MVEGLAIAAPPLATMREVVGVLEQELKKLPQIELNLVHHFSPGLYARELHIPAGVTLTGRIHKYAQFNILSKGEMSVLTEQGVKRVTAPFTVVSPPGTQRIAYAHTDCVWTTVLATEETDPDRIESLFTVGTNAEYITYLEETKCLSLA